MPLGHWFRLRRSAQSEKKSSESSEPPGNESWKKNSLQRHWDRKASAIRQKCYVMNLGVIQTYQLSFQKKRPQIFTGDVNLSNLLPTKFTIKPVLSRSVLVDAELHIIKGDRLRQFSGRVAFIICMYSSSTTIFQRELVKKRPDLYQVLLDAHPQLLATILKFWETLSRHCGDFSLSTWFLDEVYKGCLVCLGLQHHLTKIFDHVRTRARIYEPRECFSKPAMLPDRMLPGLYCDRTETAIISPGSGNNPREDGNYSAGSNSSSRDTPSETTRACASNLLHEFGSNRDGLRPKLPDSPLDPSEHFEYLSEKSVRLTASSSATQRGPRFETTKEENGGVDIPMYATAGSVKLNRLMEWVELSESFMPVPDQTVTSSPLSSETSMISCSTGDAIESTGVLLAQKERVSEAVLKVFWEDFDPWIDYLVSSAGGDFTAIYQLTPSAGSSASGSSGSTNSAAIQTSNTSVETTGASRDTSTIGKRPRQTGNPDNDEEPPQKVPRQDASASTEQGRLFACPYFKHNPRRYRHERTCLGPGWETIHRVK